MTRDKLVMMAGSAALGLALVACGGGGSSGSAAPAKPTETQAAPAETRPASPATKPPTKPAAPAGSTITAKRAAQIATERYGGDVREVESDSHDGKPTWEVEIRNSDQGRIEVDVAKASGKIVKVEHED